ncbi:mitochondrial 37S ribosomal protein uS7m [Calcarisporiella thermophila]|uniref:mitochondrial 37S ribosomal protein uS7m n=1 Tax=Calcarisporiella thermophila TaxID=911321 RepID=UPI00374278E4
MFLSRLLPLTSRIFARPLHTTPASQSLSILPSSQLIAPDTQKPLRDDPLLSQLVNTIMKDGKKARAERLVAQALLEVRRRTNADPYTILCEAIELASPMVAMSATRKGSKVVQAPRPLRERQRRRKAIVWLLEAAAKRPEKDFSTRLSSEILAVINGASGALDKKNQLHRLALANRANAQVTYNVGASSR